MTIEEIQAIRAKNDAWRKNDTTGFVVVANSVLHKADMGSDLIRQIKAYDYFCDDNPDDLHDIGFIRAPNGTVVVFWIDEIVPRKWWKSCIPELTHMMTIAPLKDAAEVNHEL